jgi:hypothetical protein
VDDAIASPMTLADQLSERIERLRSGPAYANYRHARSIVLSMIDRQAGAEGIANPSAYWTEELENFDYMLDASPLIVDKLRHHCYHLTGIRTYEYRSHKDKARDRLAEKLDALIALGGRDLLVPESPILGGFGFEIDGELYNVDTLKFYEVLIAMQRGEVLAPFRDGRERQVVVEIGAGWGGFPYAFKRLCPNTTYVIVDFPQLFLYSATYLATAFPEAKLRFWGEDTGAEIPADADFVFVPHFAFEEVRFPRLDLGINMVSFQEMTTEQVRAYVDWLDAARSPLLYSLNRDRSHYNPELTSVRDIIAERYWPHEIDVLPVSYTKMLDAAPKAKAAKGAAKIKRRAGEVAAKISPQRDADYKHVIGWRRVGQ